MLRIRLTSALLITGALVTAAPAVANASSVFAASAASQGKRVGVLGLIGHSVWTFIRIYLLKRGFLDGRHGFVLAVTAASGSFLRYSKLMFLNEAREQKK